MRPAVKWQAETARGFVLCGQGQTVATEVVEAKPPRVKSREQPPEAPARPQLAGQQVVTLEVGIVARLSGAVDRAEG